MSNLTDQMKPVPMISETKNNGSPTVLNAGYLDTLGWKWVTWLIFIGVTDAQVDLKIQESDLPGSGYADIAGKVISPLLATDDGKIKAIEISLATGRKRYQKPVCVVGNATGAAVSVIAVLSAFSTNVVDVASLDLAEVVDG